VNKVVGHDHDADAFQSYVICTSPRSGSTLLCKLLSATGQAGQSDSHFHSPSITDWIRYYGLSENTYANEHELIKAIFRAAIDRGTNNTGIFGLRLQIKSLDYFLEKLQIHSQEPYLDTDFKRIKAVFGRTLFIHLTRQNKLDQAISLELAIQTGLWHRGPDGQEIERTSLTCKPIYKPDAIEKHINDFTQAENKWNLWFDAQGLEPMRLSYDDLSKNPLQELVRIVKRLGVDPHCIDSIELPVVKLADATNEEWARRFNVDQLCS